MAHRINVILNHLQPPIASIISAQVATTETIQNFATVKDYEYRLVKESDYSAILELCEEIYDGNDFIPSSFHEWLRDKSHKTGNILFFGLEYLPESKIIATNIVKVIDGGKTGMSVGARVHSKHRGKRLWSPFLAWTHEMIKKTYPDLIRLRTTSYLSNSVSQHVQKKNGIFPIKDMTSFIYGDVAFPSHKSIDYKPNIMRPDAFEKRLINLKLIKDEDHNLQLEIITDVDEIINLLKQKYNKTEVFVDWKVYDLSINKKSMVDNKAFLKKEILFRRLTVYCNKTKSVMCLVYIDGRKRVTQTHIYAVNQADNEENILFMIVKMYQEWKNRIYPDMLIDPKCGLRFWFFVDDTLVENNSRLKQLCQGFDVVVIAEKKMR